MERNSVLRKILQTTMSVKEVDAFFSYQITDNDMSFLKEVTNEVLRNIPAQAFNCAMLSGLLGAIIFDHSKIPVAVLSGHLDFASKRIFNCENPIPYLTDKKIINETWDGHCWVEMNDLIIDISIFRTIYYGQVPKDLYDKIIANFGKRGGVLVGSPFKLNKSNFIYTPCYSMSQDVITGLVKGAEQLIKSKN